MLGGKAEVSEREMKRMFYKEEVAVGSWAQGE